MLAKGRRTARAAASHRRDRARSAARRIEALLGLLPDGAPVFAALLPDDAVEERGDESDGFLDRRILVVPNRDDLKMVDLRSIAAGGLVPPDQASMLARRRR